MRCGGVWWVCDNCRVSYFYDTIVVGVSEIWRDLASEGKWWCDRRPGDDCTVQNAHVQYVVQLLYRPVRVPQLGYNQLLQTRNYFAIHPCHNLQSLYTFHDKQSVLLGEFLLFKIWAWMHSVVVYCVQVVRKNIYSIPSFLNILSHFLLHCSQATFWSRKHKQCHNELFLRRLKYKSWNVFMNHSFVFTSNNWIWVFQLSNFPIQYIWFNFFAELWKLCKTLRHNIYWNMSAEAAAGPGVENVCLDTITDLDTKIQSIENAHMESLTLLKPENLELRDKKEISKVVHDLGPVHAVLVDLASSLQLKVDKAINDLREIRVKLSNEM